LLKTLVSFNREKPLLVLKEHNYNVDEAATYIINKKIDIKDNPRSVNFSVEEIKQFRAILKNNHKDLRATRDKNYTKKSMAEMVDHLYRPICYDVAVVVPQIKLKPVAKRKEKTSNHKDK